MVDPSVPQSRFENLAQRDDFLVRGVMRWRFAAHSVAFFKPMDTVSVDLASRISGSTMLPKNGIRWPFVRACCPCA
jgi:hypothetical protein